MLQKMAFGELCFALYIWDIAILLMKLFGVTFNEIKGYPSVVKANTGLIYLDYFVA